MGSTSSQSESPLPAASRPQEPWEPIRLCGTLPTKVVPAEQYVKQLWAALDQTLHHSKCGVGSDTPVRSGTLKVEDFTIVGAPAPRAKTTTPSGVPSTTTRIPSRDEGCRDSEERYTGTVT